MQNVNVVFDTNAYRGITRDLDEQQAKALFDKVRAAEESRNITPLLSTLTLTELLAHLADVSDPGYSHCKVATIGAYHHVLDEEKTPRLLPDQDTLLEEFLLGHPDEQRVQLNEWLGGLAAAIYARPDDTAIATLAPSLQLVKDEVTGIKQQFVDDMRMTIQSMDPKAAAIDWTLFQNDKKMRTKFLAYLRSDAAPRKIAELFVLKNLTKVISPTEMSSMIQDVAMTFPAPLKLYLQMMERIAGKDGYNMDNIKEKRWNTIWDINLLFSIAEIGPKKEETVFVTNEKWLNRVCHEIKLATSIIKPPEYLVMLGI